LVASLRDAKRGVWVVLLCYRALYPLRDAGGATNGCNITVPFDTINSLVASLRDAEMRLGGVRFATVLCISTEMQK